MAADFTSLYNGLEVQIPLLNGKTARYINFDNAASTPPLKAVQEYDDRFKAYYGCAHRGAR